MRKQELLARLTAALGAAGLLGVAAPEAQAQTKTLDHPPTSTKTPAKTPAKTAKPQPKGTTPLKPATTSTPAIGRPAAQPMYGVTIWGHWEAGRTQQAQELEQSALALIAYAQTPEGKADMAQDAEFSKLISELRDVTARLAQARAQATPAQASPQLKPQPAKTR